jgi:hypothetical protein
MSQIITYYFDCPHGCGGEAEAGATLDLTQPDDGPLRIDIDMAVSQTFFTCNTCGHDFCTGDLTDGVYDEEGGDCDHEDEDEDEGEDEDEDDEDDEDES